MPDSKRYEGRPLHRFLELYVLEAIGELSPPDRQNLEKMAPKLKQIYGGGETWHEAIARRRRISRGHAVSHPGDV